mmetsp:Transcript_4906/g.6848  ORF Transcript_4906/g.6848 Transcript_4906/m.6848 type:complete len:293 (+) Transcript_4906:112-990(+)
MGSGASIVKDYTEVEFKEAITNFYGKHAASKFYKRFKNKQGIVTQDKIEKIMKAAKDVFLSHNWGKDSEGRDNHARVVSMAKYLEDQGIKCWIDEQEMSGDINRAMDNGINFSRTFIVCVTEDYMRKIDGQGPNEMQDNCLKEFKYAVTSKTPARMLAVVMEKNCCATSDWFGPLEATLGSSLYCGFTSDDDFEQSMDRIVVELKKRLEYSMGDIEKEVEGDAEEEAEEDDEEPEYGDDDDDMVCDNGHKLKEYSTPGDGYTCDVCGESKSSGTVLFGCRICDYDKCSNCLE